MIKRFDSFLRVTPKSTGISLALLGFYLFVAMGPLPVKFNFIVWHHFFTILTSLIILSIFISRGNKNSYNITDLTLITLQIFYIPSVIFSDDMAESLYRYLLQLGFALTFLMLTKIKIDDEFYGKNYKLSLIALLATSFLIIILFLTTDHTNIYRMALVINYEDLRSFGRQPDNAVDPNHTGMGLMFLFAFCLPGLHKYHKGFSRFLWIFIITLLVMICSAILESRTAMIGILIAILTYSRLVYRQNSIYFFPVIIVGSFLFFAIAFFLLLRLEIFDLIISRFDINGIIADATSQDGRIFLLEEAISVFTSNYKTLLWGRGYYLMNPHNDYIKIFVNSGVIAGLLFHAYLLMFYFRIKKNSIKKIKIFWIVFLPLLFAMTTYGHVKLFWLGLGMSWILSYVNLEYEENMRPKNLSKIDNFFQ